MPCERSATAACWCCAAQLPAQDLLWMRGPHVGTFVAVCGVCDWDAQEDSAADAGVPDRYTRLQVCGQSIPRYLRL